MKSRCFRDRIDGLPQAKTCVSILSVNTGDSLATSRAITFTGRVAQSV